MMEMAATVMGASHKRNHTQQQQRENSYENDLKHRLIFSKIISQRRGLITKVYLIRTPRVVDLLSRE
jgi:hypothetical protein